MCRKQVSRVGTKNYIPQNMWDLITCPWPRYLLLAHQSSLICRRGTIPHEAKYVQHTSLLRSLLFSQHSTTNYWSIPKLQRCVNVWKWIYNYVTHVKWKGPWRSCFTLWFLFELRPKLQDILPNSEIVLFGKIDFDKNINYVAAFMWKPNVSEVHSERRGLRPVLWQQDVP